MTFRNGTTIKADLIIGADGIRSAVRSEIGIVADKKSAPQTCYRLNVLTKDIKERGLVDYAYEPAMYVVSRTIVLRCSDMASLLAVSSGVVWKELMADRSTTRSS